MKFQKLGNSDIEISALGFGGNVLTDFFGPVNDVQSLKVLNHAVDLGLTFMDTANSYGGGVNEGDDDGGGGDGGGDDGGDDSGIAVCAVQRAAASSSHQRAQRGAPPSALGHPCLLSIIHGGHKRHDRQHPLD